MKNSITFSIVILALVFGFYLTAGVGCKDSTDPEKKEPEATKPKIEKEQQTAIENSSKLGKDYLVSMYGKEAQKGGWGKQSVGLDAFACLGLMSDPNPIKPTEKPLSDMIDYYIETQSDKGNWESAGKGKQPVYETSLVIMTLKRALTLEPEHAKKKEIESAIKKAVDYLVLAQVDETPIDENDVTVTKDSDAFTRAHYGGWGYGFNRAGKAPANLSTSHFAIDALYESGYKDDPKVKEAFKKAIDFLEYCQNSGEKVIEIPAGIDESTEVQKIKYANDGGGIYGPGIAKPGVAEKDGFKVPHSYGSMTYVLLKEYVFTGVPKNDPKVQAAFNWLKKAENFTFAENPGFEGEAKTAGLFYQLYTASKTLGVMGEEIIKDSKGEEHNWRKEMQDQLIKMQKKEGYWMNSFSRWFENSPILATGYALTALGNTMN